VLLKASRTFEGGFLFRFVRRGTRQLEAARLVNNAIETLFKNFGRIESALGNQVPIKEKEGTQD